MVTSKEILEKTGLTMQTMIRWYKQGIIPRPQTMTSPSGRGKNAYWPDWVLSRCVRLVELQKQGHTLRSAVQVLAFEGVQKNLEKAQKTVPISDVTVQIAGTPATLGVVFSMRVAKEIATVTSSLIADEIRLKLAEMKALDQTLQLYVHGFNPVLAFDGAAVEITCDFLISHGLADDGGRARPLLVCPLVRSLQGLAAAAGLPLPPWKMLTEPAPKVRAQQGDVVVETEFALGGPIGFEMLHETTAVVGQLKPESDKTEEK